MSSHSSSAELLTQLLAEGKKEIGEIILGNDFSLRHREDASLDVNKLKLHGHPEAAREIARYDAAGNYRPLKTAPNLCRGWVLELKDIDEMALALDFFYPAALHLYEACLQKKLKTTSLRDTLERQSGMYRVTQKLSDEEASKLVEKNCHQGCLRHVLWPMTSDQEAGVFSQKEKNKIPLLCREACNLLVAAARQIVKQEKTPDGGAVK